MKTAKILAALGLLSLCLWPGLLAGAEISPYGNPWRLVTVGRVAVLAEVVQSPEKVFLGLSHRRELPEGRGMLFIMPGVEQQIFCMRGMRFPLDFLWIAYGRVVGLEKNIPTQFPGDLVSPRPVNYVLEVPGGFCNRHGIKVGDPVKWSEP
jgi:uncharacterized membrane protein (UPF0127 family)